MPSLVMMRVVSGLVGATGVEVIGGGLVGALEALFELKVTQVRWGTAGGSGYWHWHACSGGETPGRPGGGLGEASGGREGVAVWLILRRKSLSYFPILVVRMRSLSHTAVSLLFLVGGGPILEAITHLLVGFPLLLHDFEDRVFFVSFQIRSPLTHIIDIMIFKCPGYWWRGELFLCTGSGPKSDVVVYVALVRCHRVTVHCHVLTVRMLLGKCQDGFVSSLPLVVVAFLRCYGLVFSYYELIHTGWVSRGWLCGWQGPRRVVWRAWRYIADRYMGLKAGAILQCIQEKSSL